MVVEKVKVFPHFKRKQDGTVEGSRERLLCFSAWIKGRGRDQSLEKTEERGRERRRDGPTDSYFSTVVTGLRGILTIRSDRSQGSVLRTSWTSTAGFLGVLGSTPPIIGRHACHSSGVLLLSRYFCLFFPTVDGTRTLSQPRGHLQAFPPSTCAWKEVEDEGRGIIQSGFLESPERRCCVGGQASARTKISVWSLWWEGLSVKSVSRCVWLPVTSPGWE